MMEKEKEEVEKLRNLTEEERRLELRNNPKVSFLFLQVIVDRFSILYCN